MTVKEEGSVTVKEEGSVKGKGEQSVKSSQILFYTRVINNYIHTQ